jgi:hypothetical protein
MTHHLFSAELFSDTRLSQQPIGRKQPHETSVSVKNLAIWVKFVYSTAGLGDENPEITE